MGASISLRVAPAVCAAGGPSRGKRRGAEPPRRKEKRQIPMNVRVIRCFIRFVRRESRGDSGLTPRDEADAQDLPRTKARKDLEFSAITIRNGSLWTTG